MDFKNFKQRMDDWYQQCKAYDALQSDRLARWRNLEPESAQFLMELIHVNQIKNTLELGTSTGFSTAWLAYALKQISGGVLTTIEIDEIRSQSAQESLIALDLAGVVDFLISDARDFLAHTRQNYQLIFLDAERSEYLNYVNDLKRLLKLTAGNTLVVDNVISHASQLEDFLRCFSDDDRFETQVLEVGAGLFTVTYKDEKSSI